MFFTIVIFFAVLGLLVLVHELGHFVTARKGGVKVDEFGLGLPPRMFGVYKNPEGKWKPVGIRSKEAPNTIWSLNWIPLGGFVKIKGEEGDSADQLDSFANKSVGRRIWIISAGVLMNVVLAAVLLSIGLAIGSPQIIDEAKLPKLAQVKDTNIMIIEILSESPAESAGLEPGDKIISIDGQAFSAITEFQNHVSQKVGSATTLVVQRKDETLTMQIIPEILPEVESGGVGVALVKTGIVSYPWYVAWWYGITGTLTMVWQIIAGFFLVIKNLIVSRELIADVYGPVGIANLVGDAARLGFIYILQFTAMLSVIIAVINFFPFPALDGGRVFFLLLEGIRGKPVNQKFETIMHNSGFILLMLLMVLVTFRDIARFSGNWWEKIINLF